MSSSSVSVPVCLTAHHAQLGEARLAQGRRHGVGHLTISSQRGDAFPVVHVVRFPEFDTAIIPRGGEDGAGDVPAHAPHTRPMLVKLPSLSDVKPEEGKCAIFIVLIT